MKYNFDEKIDRINDEGSFSSKWANNERMAKMFMTDQLPEDRLCFFLADMDFKVAPEILEGMQKVIDHGIMGYSQAPQRYFDAVARWMRDRFDWNIDPKHIRIHNGGHDAIVECINKLTAPGDGIIVLTPSYYYRWDVAGTGRHYVAVRMNNDNGYYTINFDRLEEACREVTNTMLIFIQPHNPTGRTWSREEILKVAEICRRNNVIILSDEVHMDIKRKNVTVEPFMKVAGPKGIITVTGINKTFNLAGLAVTNTIIEDEEINARMGESRNNSTPFGYAACIASYTKGDQWVDELNDYLDDVIDYAVERFHKEMPKVKVWKPEGTYILWLDFSGYGLSNEQLNEKIAGQCHIGMSDGAGMETFEGEQYRRMCITCPKADVREGIDRLVRAFEQ